MKQYDKLLGITTEGEQLGPTSMQYHRYEPTPYSALEELFQVYELRRGDTVVDFGCGRGRLNFFIHYRSRASVRGVEMNELLYKAALRNLDSYLKKVPGAGKQVQFHCCLAQEYAIRPQENKFYFFNPFSLPIFRQVVHNIMRSWEDVPREIELILYYPSQDYMYFLEQETPFVLQQEVLLPEAARDISERFLIYRLADV